MSRISVGVIDYGIGNHASVIQCLNSLGFKVVLSDQPGCLDSVDVLLIPGVGAFPPTMAALNDRDLAKYLREAAKANRPIIGLCVGMQVLATQSFEHGETPGLDLIPGEIIPFAKAAPHIGWNSIESKNQDPLFGESNGQIFYFNHSFVYRGSAEYQMCVSRHSDEFPAIIRKKRVVGIQFHPEKSQFSGGRLLTTLIRGLTHA